MMMTTPTTSMALPMSSTTSVKLMPLRASLSGTRGVPHPADVASRPKNLASQVGALPDCANDDCRTQAPISVCVGSKCA